LMADSFWPFARLICFVAYFDYICDKNHSLWIRNQLK
jgi:hypothetical protein